MIINYAAKNIQIKFIFFGELNAKKDEMLKPILEKFHGENSQSKASVISCGNVMISGANWSLKTLVVICDPSDFYATTRPAVLELADGIIFVSNADIIADKKCLDELTMYKGDRLYDFPIAFMHNENSNGYNIQEALDTKRFTKSKICANALESFICLVQMNFPSFSSN